MSQRLKIFTSVLVVTALFITLLWQRQKDPAPTQPQEVQAEPRLTMAERFPLKFSQGATLASELGGWGVDFTTVLQIVKAAEPYKNLARIRSGIRYQVHFEDLEAVSEETKPPLSLLEMRLGADQVLRIEKGPEGQWDAELVDLPTNVELVTFSGEVLSSLWQSAAEVQMDPLLISELAEIFAWQVDFAREVRVGDRWRISVEKRFVEDEFVGWGDILAADYQNSGTLYEATLFRKDGEKMGYFAPDGSSLRRMFLKSPLKFGRISSRFQRRRFHPILKVHRPHLGVDYAAPTGTPVRAVGDGTITTAGWQGGGGNTLRIRHNATYTTAYKHLNGFARGIRRGSKVTQGQVIGYVGSTGMSTGPHLHFEFFKNGTYVDPLSQNFPSADPVPPELMAEFGLQVAELRGSLPAWEDLELALREPAGAEQSQ